MGARLRWLKEIRSRLEESNKKTSEKMSELILSISEKSSDEDVQEVTKGILEAIEFLPGLVLFALNVTVDKRVSIGEKIKIGLLVALLVSPADLLLMELIGPLALMDDVVLIGYLVYSIGALIGNLDEEVVEDNWVGNPEHATQFVEAVRSLAGMGGTRKLEKFIEEV